MARRNTEARRSKLRSTFLVGPSGYAPGWDVEKSLAAGFDAHMAAPSPRWRRYREISDR